jgi:hypothetical protein
MTRWYAVVNADNTVLAVYGSALFELASAKAEAIEQALECATMVRETLGTKPTIGERLRED